MTTQSLRDARAGDWIEVHVPGGGPPRRALILEVMGDGPHRRYRVRWDEDTVSIHYPADDDRLVRHAAGD